MFVLYPVAAGTSAAAASHASDAQNKHLNNDDEEEEAPPCQRRRVGTSPRRDMPLAANDSLEGDNKGGVEEGTTSRRRQTSRHDMPPLALLADDDLQEGEGGLEDVDDEWMESADLLEEEAENLVDDEFHNEQEVWCTPMWNTK